MLIIDAKLFVLIMCQYGIKSNRVNIFKTVVVIKDNKR